MGTKDQTIVIPGTINPVLNDTGHIKDKNNNVKFKLKSMECISCHTDIHKGQFNDTKGKTDCSKCHRPVDWFAEKFNHENHSTFSLKGAHSQVPCQECHKMEEVNGTKIVRYKPLNSECKFCHSDKEKRRKG